MQAWYLGAGSREQGAGSSVIEPASNDSLLPTPCSLLPQKKTPAEAGVVYEPWKCVVVDDDAAITRRSGRTPCW
ncbi:MAG: hypothetical protein KC983_06280, partial [Phycisphaerales bacterium]|nr:hypothetical protein [Phycisphaerales bacterium]